MAVGRQQLLLFALFLLVSSPVLVFAQPIATGQLSSVDSTKSVDGVGLPDHDDKLKSVDAGYDCPDHTFSNELSGYVHSPLYPAHYPNSSDCLTTISVPDGSTVQLTLYAFNTEPCCDKLNVIDGDRDGALIKSLSGRLKPGSKAVFQSTGRFMTLNFTSSPQIDDYGFYARFDATPGNDDKNPSKSSDCPTANQFYGSVGSYGVLVSPSWPYQYPNEMDCYYHIDVIQGLKIKLRVNYFNTEAGCDYLMVYDDDLGGADSPLLKNMTGRYESESVNFESSGSSVTLRFISNPTITYDGFSLTYTAV